MNKKSKQGSEPIIIKRYASRKLYDAAAKEYVTLEDIARYIREGRDVKIIDKSTGEDLTRQYLVQIIADFESQGENALPLNILTDLVRHYQEQASSVASAMTPAFLGQMFEAYKAQQEKALSELGELGSNAMDPEKVMGAMNEAMRDWQEKQSEFFAQTMRQWGFGAPQSAQNGEPSQQAAPTQSVDEAQTAEKEAKIRAIEDNLEALQDQLKKLR
ncbi:MAG: polyhydroxyalkanoate synthesis repressor PhaR [Nitratireductor sp.]|nr:polyhydroxyalkanoate synthesis repressor PhaR [Nitratireductor sp.]